MHELEIDGNSYGPDSAVGGDSVDIKSEDEDAEGEDDYELAPPHLSPSSSHSHPHSHSEAEPRPQDVLDDAGLVVLDPEDREAFSPEDFDEDGDFEDDFESEDDDDGDGEYVARSRSARRSYTADVSTPARELRNRTASGARYNPYPYPSPSPSSYDSSMSTRSRRPTASTHSSTSSSSSFPPYYGGSGGRGRRSRTGSSLPVPIPVPNLTKKSRGRRVPTLSNIESFAMLRSPTDEYADGDASGSPGSAGGIAKGARVHMCKVPGCGKCFARGEHLKRHVRSIHTYEKREFHLRFISVTFPSCDVGHGLMMIFLFSPYSAQMPVPGVREGLQSA